jgi:alkanesulfonate monooxygenase SsuD/methylene tetrahydromethanopterin reductase-like flavin-dependent oxidoreductase (luciferase family)
MPNIGVAIPSPLPADMQLPDVTQLARAAETAQFDCIWAEDHLVHGDAAVLDIVCVLAAAAAATEKIEVGTAVFVPSLRNLAWALKQVATLQLVAGGRLQLGVALGGASEQEYGLAGLNSSGQRARTDEFLGDLAAMRRGGGDVSVFTSEHARLALGSSAPSASALDWRNLVRGSSPRRSFRGRLAFWPPDVRRVRGIVEPLAPSGPSRRVVHARRRASCCGSRSGRSPRTAS